MFEILYRINEDWMNPETFNPMKDDISGLFAINVNGNSYGFYHNEPFEDKGYLSELLTRWFIDLIEAYFGLCNSGYAAVSDIESYNTWIEFKKIQDTVQISIIQAVTAFEENIVVWDKSPEAYVDSEEPYKDVSSSDENFDLEPIIYLGSLESSPKLTPFDDFEYGEWHHQLVKLSDIHAELLKKASQYIDDIRKISKKLLKNKENAELKKLLSHLISFCHPNSNAYFEN